MSFCKVTTYKWLCVLSLGLILGLAGQSLGANDQINFRWAVLQDTDEGLRSVDFKTPSPLNSSATIQLYLHPDSHTYLYLLLLDSSKNFTPIFPVSKDYYDNFPPGEVVRIPAGKDRFTIVPPPGREAFYLLASADRLDKVEERMEDCILHPGDVEAQAKLFTEVKMLRRKYSSLTQATEKGVPVSGTMRNLGITRSSKKKESFVAAHVTAYGFYSKILRLDHE